MHMKKEILPVRSWFLEKAAIAAALFALVACATSAHEVITLTPDGPETWEGQVGEAVSIWNEALRGSCGDVFNLDTTGLRVKLYDVWPGAANERGYYDGDEIAVRKTTNEVERSTLVHELGHVIGLQHSGDKTSVMYPIVSVTYRPSDTDIENAMSALDCP